MRRRWTLGWLVVGLLTAPTAAKAGPAADFDSQLAEVWAQCRAALYQSAPSHLNGPAATDALRTFTTAWSQLETRWATTPPPQYSEDGDFAEELSDIGAIAAQARHQGEAGRVDQAHASLQEVPALLAEMRHRNGLENYTDTVEAFDDKLAETADDLLDQAELTADQQLLLLEQAAQLAYLAERLEKRAPARVSDDADFLDLAETLARQTHGLRSAALAGQRDPVIAILEDLRRSFDQFDLAYG
jgi:hypothetical protein